MADLGDVGRVVVMPVRGGNSQGFASAGGAPGVGVISGTTQQGGVAGALDVSLAMQGVGQIAHTTAGPDGSFAFHDLPRGTYWVRVESRDGRYRQRMFGPFVVS